MTSPCPSCWSLADCGTCLPRLRWEAATAPPEPPACLLCVDITHLLAAGEHLPRIAERLGRKPESIRQHARRHHLTIPTDRRDYAA